MYKKLKNEFTGVLTGKGSAWGGSLIRPEATGYGCVYFIQAMPRRRGEDLRGKRVAVSGSGNARQFAVEKLLQLGGGGGVRRRRHPLRARQGRQRRRRRRLRPRDDAERHAPVVDPRGSRPAPAAHHAVDPQDLRPLRQ